MNNNQILALRKSLGETQKSFAERIGVSLTTLWRLEKGHEQASKTLTKLLQVIANKSYTHNSASDIKNL